jgi:hypothetical protein
MNLMRPSACITKRSPRCLCRWRAQAQTDAVLLSLFHRHTVLNVFALLAVVTFLLRIFYATHLYEDDGLWFTAAQELLRGKALYREIYFDKPPAIVLVYAGLFKAFGAHLLTIRLFTIFYSLAVSAVLYQFGKWLYNTRTGLIAAAMFTIFSTTYQTGHFQGLNTDFLMTLPYAAGAFLLLRSRADVFHQPLPRAHSRGLALGGGALVGIASQINPKAIFELVFFALFLVLAYWWQRRDAETERRGDTAINKSSTASESHALAASPRRPIAASLFALAGFAIGVLPFLIYIAATKSFSFYWLDVWDWGARYARYYPASKIATTAVVQSLDYFAVNNTLLVALGFVLVMTIKRRSKRKQERGGAKLATEADFKATSVFKADATLLVWFAVSYAAMALGGRFFGHYFFQVLPSLCLIGARGLIGLISTLKAKERAANGNLNRGVHGWIGQSGRVWLVLLALGFAITMIRFHSRTVELAVDWVRGKNSASRADWIYEKLDHEEQSVAAVVSNPNEEPFTMAQLGVAAIPADGLRTRGIDGSSDYLFVWGYRPEIYYWSGLIPASKYLSTQPLTGVPADVHYFGDDYHSVLDGQTTAAARAELARELEQTRPECIIDELGFFNNDLSINSYPELREVMRNYKSIGTVERFFLYRRKEFTKSYHRRHPDTPP